MNSEITILEKPDWISWDEIRKVLWEAHAENRERGIIMRNPSLPGEEIRKKIEGNGKMYCAIMNDKLVGTAAVIKKELQFWFDKRPSTYAYLCFAGVLPTYKGRGIYKQLYQYRFDDCVAQGMNRFMFDTHEGNKRVIDINRSNGFKIVDFKPCKNHNNLMMVKWLEGCPYSDFRLRYEFYRRKYSKLFMKRLRQFRSKYFNL